MGSGGEPRIGHRFEQAVAYALEAHAHQTRKATGVPYASHLLAVAALVLDDGGDEDEGIAGLLHDAPEDQGGQERLDDIRRRFGPRVADIVDACTETVARPKPPWGERKRSSLARIRRLDDPGIVRVILADKVSNARSMVDDRRRVGPALFDRFNAPEACQRWYYEQLLDAFAPTPASPALLEDLGDAVARLFPPPGHRARLADLLGTVPGPADPWHLALLLAGLDTGALALDEDGVVTAGDGARWALAGPGTLAEVAAAVEPAVLRA